MIIGHTDEPLHSRDKEWLGVTGHMEALSEFVAQCNTPLTIAIQGDWGTGKTSMMNLVRDKLTGQGIQTVWFNTWQFSQFAMQDDVPMVLLMELLDAVGYDKEQMKCLVINLVRRLAVLSATMMAGSDASAAMERATREDPVALVSQIKDLKQKLERAVSEKIAKSKTNRMVIFVDDLDRMAPEKAVEVLEVVKNFLDIKGCIFVLAVDYDVVSRGVRKKYGEDMDEMKGRSFFDKIIQLPFNLPVGQYTIPHYIEKLLSPRLEDLTHFVQLAAHSVGTNPRTLKRMANTLALLHIVAKSKGSSATEAPEFTRLLFGVLCLQMAYEPVYNQILVEKLGASLFEWSKDKRIQVFSHSLAACPGKTEDVHTRFLNFLQALEESLPAQGSDYSEEGHKADAGLFESVLYFSGITATGSSEAVGITEVQSKGFDPVLLASLSGMVEELRTQYAAFFSSLSADAHISGWSCENINIPVTLGGQVVFVLGVSEGGINICCYTEERVGMKREFHARFARLFPQLKDKFTYNGRAYAFMCLKDPIPWSGEAAAHGKTDMASSRITQTRRVLKEWRQTLLPALHEYYTPKMAVFKSVEALRQKVYERIAPLFPPSEGWEWEMGSSYFVGEGYFLRTRKKDWGEGYWLVVEAEGNYMHTLYVGMFCSPAPEKVKSPSREALFQAWQRAQSALAGNLVDRNEWWVLWRYLPEDVRDWCRGHLDDDNFAYALSPAQEEKVLALLEEDFKRFKATETMVDAVAAE